LFQYLYQQEYNEGLGELGMPKKKGMKILDSLRVYEDELVAQLWYAFSMLLMDAYHINSPQLIPFSSHHQKYFSSIQQ
jgi:hypothetical protein